jgi:hypothetical protein
VTATRARRARVARRRRGLLRLRRARRRFRVPRPAWILAPGAVLALWGWIAMNEGGHLIGLLFLLALGITAWPSAMLLLVMTPALLQERDAPRKHRIKVRILDRTRPAVPAKMIRIVLFADRHRCVACRSRGPFNIDHYRPWGGGGLTALHNMMTLCVRCNKVKSNYWRDDDGYVHYHPFMGSDNSGMARKILSRERRARRSPVRWVRMAWALAA